MDQGCSLSGYCAIAKRISIFLFTNPSISPAVRAREREYYITISFPLISRDITLTFIIKTIKILSKRSTI